jgi:hypothetical protein
MKARFLFACVALAAATCGTIAVAQQTYQPGDKVEVYSSMSGKWEKGTIVRIDGAMADGRPRYMFQADDQTLASAFWGTTAESIRVAAPAPAPAAAPAPRPAPVPAPAVRARIAPPTAARPVAAPQPAGSCAGGAQGNVRIAGAVQAPLGDGLFPNGGPLGTPGQTNFLPNKNGQKSIVAVAPPGRGSFIGRYSLMVGGTWSTFSTRDLGGGVTERTLNWNVPAQANVLVINADGSWYRKSGSQRFFGHWIDLGQNVAQLIGYDGDDWSGSMQIAGGVCQMEMRGPLGQNEWGRRL